jgi:hypothetical protein
VKHKAFFLLNDFVVELGECNLEFVTDLMYKKYLVESEVVMMLKEKK